MGPAIYALFSLFIVYLNIQQIKCLEKDMTISIDPGKEDCFYLSAKVGQILDIEYQVIDGSHGKLDIGFTLSEPAGRILVSDFKSPEKVHRFDVKIGGDYKFCFDNTFSSVNSKTVFFNLILENDDDDDFNDNDFGIGLDGLTPEEFYEMKVQDIQDALARVRSHLTKVRHVQDYLRNQETRERNIAEEVYFMVNTWSSLQILAMLVVGLVQVLMVKSLFGIESNNKVKTIWNKIHENIR